MIYVVDNGENYSDHSVFFVESDMTPVEVDEMLKLGTNDGRYYSVVFMADVLEWRDATQRCTFLHGCYIGSSASAYAIAHESESLLREQAAIEVEERKKWPTRRMFATDELARREASSQATDRAITYLNGLAE